MKVIWLFEILLVLIAIGGSEYWAWATDEERLWHIERIDELRNDYIRACLVDGKTLQTCDEAREYLAELQKAHANLQNAWLMHPWIRSNKDLRSYEKFTKIKWKTDPWQGLTEKINHRE